MRIISFCFYYKLNDLLKETCTYVAIIKVVQVFNRGQTGPGGGGGDSIYKKGRDAR